MCWLTDLFKKKTQPEVIDIGLINNSSPRIDKQTPSPAWFNEELPTYWADKPLNKPTYIIADLIKHLEFRIQIHETYWGLVEDDPAIWFGFGSVEFHQWAIEGYQNAIFYLKRIGE